MEECWRPVVGYEGKYEVSSKGRVRSFVRNKKGHLLKPGLTSVGYPSVALGRGNTRLVHCLVAEAFLGVCPEGQEVRHLDGSRSNNNPNNLKYGTRADNVRDAKKHGTFWSGLKKKLKITLNQREEIRKLYQPRIYTLKKLAKQFSVSEATILKVLRGGHASVS